MGDDLTGKTPCAGLLPLSAGQVRLSEGAPGCMTLICPYPGQARAAADMLRATHGLDLPAPGRCTQSGDARALWFGHEAALLMGPPADPGLAEHAALSDQSDAWAVVELNGTDTAAVLARLTPLDLRPARFGVGHTARTDLRHMAVSVTRTGPARFMVLAFRSMAGTLVHDLAGAMDRLAARRG